jgi:hypothetical protein
MALPGLYFFLLQKVERQVKVCRGKRTLELGAQGRRAMCVWLSGFQYDFALFAQNTP